MNSPKTVLIIEDEQDISRIVNDYLRVQGFSAFITENAGDGLQAVRQRQPDFIILDLTLPDADGIEVCRKLRTLTAAPILILSARSSDTDKVLALGFGADDYMTKPFSLSELVARVQAHLRRMADPKLPVSPQQRLHSAPCRLIKMPARSWPDSWKFLYPPKNLICYTFWPPTLIKCLPNRSCWIMCGGIRLMSRIIRSRSTFGGSVRNWNEPKSSPPILKPCGASDINSTPMKRSSLYGLENLVC